ncbi:MAG TPA: hypothetical protein PLX89_01750 [Verrucomicrobiota bacterium]|nr:hypothetical protein [Verrucomicrobiales bacterium]HRI11701.1 hypothetical protein [Verrucomicrobiota bacterium]
MSETRRADSQRTRTRYAAFSFVELLTLLAVLAVLGTLLTSFVGNSRVRARQITCMANLRQVGQAIELYTKETKRRPRTLSRVMQFEASPTAKTFLCPADPALRRPEGPDRATNLFWGNFANASQEPWGQDDLRDPESGSWAAELAEVQESEPFSYLHPLSWRRSAWQRLASLGPDTGAAVCQLHGVRIPASVTIPSFKYFLQYEGQVFRVQHDGAVVDRKVFRPGAGTDKPAGTDYPWELYTDAQLTPSR